MTQKNGLGGEHTGEWVPGGGLCRAWKDAATSGVRSPARKEDGGRGGGGGSLDTTCLSQGFGEPSGKWIPGTPIPQRRWVEDTPPTPGLREEQACPSKARIRPWVNPGPSQDPEARRPRQTHSVQ